MLLRNKIPDVFVQRLLFDTFYNYGVQNAEDETQDIFTSSVLIKNSK